MKIQGYTLPELKKSIVAFMTPGVVALTVALSPESPGGVAITAAEGIGILVAMCGTGWLVYATKNADAPAAVKPPVT